MTLEWMPADLSNPSSNTLKIWYPLPFLSVMGSLINYKVTNPKKGALIMIWFLGYQDKQELVRAWSSEFWHVQCN